MLRRALRGSAALSAAAALTGAPPGMGAAEAPTFRFGLIADIQYCDCADANNFSGSDLRKYRGTLQQTRKAVDAWNALSPAFVVQLGDLIDGQNAGGYGAGLAFDGPQSDVALGRVAAELARCRAPIHHAIGNHELYNFDWAGLRARLQRPDRGWRVAADSPAAGAAADALAAPAEADAPFYYSWRPSRGWTFVMLNAYAVSMEQDSSSVGYAAAAALLQQHNPRCYDAIATGKSGFNFFEGVDEEHQRFVPFNGGLGAPQLAWLRAELRAASARGDHVVVCSHVPLLAAASSPRTIVYDAPEALEALAEEGRGAVVAVFAGHFHRGGYAVDNAGCHHVTVNSPLNFDECYGHCDVFTDRIELVGAKGLPSRTLRFPPRAPARARL